MDCEQAVEAVSAALDGELTAAEQAELETHLSVCSACRALAEDFFSLNAALTENEPVPPQSLADQVMERIAEQDKAVPISAGRRPGWRRWVGLAAAAALVLCAGGLGAWLKNGGMGMDAANSAPMAHSGANSAVTGTSGGSNGANMDTVDPGSSERAFTDGNAFLEDQLSPSTAPGAASMPSDRDNSSPAPAPAALAEPAEPAASAASTEPAGGKQPAASNAAVNEEQALELVFEYLGGYEEYPEAELRRTDAYGTSTPAYCLKTEKTEDAATSEYCLEYVRVSSNALYHEIHLYENVTYEEEDEVNSTVTCNWFAVDVDGSGEILVEFPENYDAERESEYIDSYVNAVTGD